MNHRYGSRGLKHDTGIVAVRSMVVPEIREVSAAIRPAERIVQLPRCITLMRHRALHEIFTVHIPVGAALLSPSGVC
jgi:hypothetical protein